MTKKKCDDLRMFGTQYKCKDCGAVWDAGDTPPDECKPDSVPVAMKAFDASAAQKILKEYSGASNAGAINLRGSAGSPNVVAPGVPASDAPTRQATDMRFDLIPGDVYAEIAKVFAQGAAKYGDYNWQKARMTGDMDPINHAMKHVMYYNSGVADDEDPDGMDIEIHLRHAIVNLMFELHYQLNQDKFGDRFNGHAAKVCK